MEIPANGFIPDVLVEDRKVRYLRLCVDLSLSLIYRGEVSREVAETIPRNLRHLTVSLFPDKGDTFDMIYAPRFRRAIDETYGIGETPRGQETE
jgi:hypothetical protein